MTCPCRKDQDGAPARNARPPSPAPCEPCKAEHLRRFREAAARGDRFRAVWHLMKAWSFAPPAEKPVLLQLRRDYQLRRPVSWPET